MLLGAHESVAGGMPLAFERGREDGCEAIQIFARPSQQWRARPLPLEELSAFRSEHAGGAAGRCCRTPRTSSTWAAATRWCWARSREALEEEMVRAEELGIDYVVLHPGAHLGVGEAEGLRAGGGRRWRELHAPHARVPGAAADRADRRAGQLPGLPLRAPGAAAGRHPRRRATGHLLRHLPRPRRRLRPDQRRGLRRGVRRAGPAGGAGGAAGVSPQRLEDRAGQPGGSPPGDRRRHAGAVSVLAPGQRPALRRARPASWRRRPGRTSCTSLRPQPGAPARADRRAPAAGAPRPRDDGPVDERTEDLARAWREDVERWREARLFRLRAPTGLAVAGRSRSCWSEGDNPLDIGTVTLAGGQVQFRAAAGRGGHPDMARRSRSTTGAPTPRAPPRSTGERRAQLRADAPGIGAGGPGAGSAGARAARTSPGWSTSRWIRAGGWWRASSATIRPRTTRTTTRSARASCARSRAWRTSRSMGGRCRWSR